MTESCQSGCILGQLLCDVSKHHGSIVFNTYCSTNPLVARRELEVRLTPPGRTWQTKWLPSPAQAAAAPPPPPALTAATTTTPTPTNQPTNNSNNNNNNNMNNINNNINNNNNNNDHNPNPNRNSNNSNSNKKNENKTNQTNTTNKMANINRISTHCRSGHRRVRWGPFPSLTLRRSALVLPNLLSPLVPRFSNLFGFHSSELIESRWKQSLRSGTFWSSSHAAGTRL